MDFICECRCGNVFLKTSLLWKHKIEACQEPPCYGCENNLETTNPDVNEYVLKSENFVKIKKQDEFACARAIVVAKAFADLHPLRFFLSQQSFLQLSFAKDLHEEAGIVPGACDIDEIKLFQQTLPEYQLIFIKKTCDHMPFHVAYVGPEAEKCICIYQHDGIYDVIKRMHPGFILRILGY